ncbi:MAG: hypothetical protein ABR595_09580 [Psychroflexus sp.]
MSALHILKPQYVKQNIVFILAITYVFSGLHKLNLVFINTVWSQGILIDFLDFSKEIAFSKPFKAVGFSVGFIELLLGIGLFTKFKKQASYALIVMHIFILIYLGPLGINFNEVVWIWNIIMIYHLLYVNKKITLGLILKSKTYLIAVILIAVNPILYIFGKSSPYLSFSFYSGTKSFQIIEFDNKKIPKDLKTYIYLKDTNTSRIDLNTWALKELKVPFPSRESQFGSVIKKLKSSDKFQIKSAYQIKYPFKDKLYLSEEK